MKVESASIALASQSLSLETHSVSERLRTWVGERRPDFERLEASDRFASAFVSLSAAAQTALAADSAPTEPTGAAEVEPDTDALDDDPRLQLLSRMIELMTGERPRGVRADDLRRRPDRAAEQALSELKDPRTAGGDTPPQRAGWGLEYDRHEVRFEAEATRFAAQGEIRTADGQTIRFAVELEMTRTYYEESHVSLRAGDAVFKDPLVINFNGNAADLSGLRFDFDLDADGSKENIAFVGAGSGLLALDRNGNGRVDDGRELFGALSGDGFADLEALDGDHNGWIDENDAAFARLMAWIRDDQGNDQLVSLADAGVGALYLGRVDTPFALRDGANTPLGQVRATGLYAKESGSVGTMQQIDIAV